MPGCFPAQAGNHRQSIIFTCWPQFTVTRFNIDVDFAEARPPRNCSAKRFIRPGLTAKHVNRAQKTYPPSTLFVLMSWLLRGLKNCRKLLSPYLNFGLVSDLWTEPPTSRLGSMIQALPWTWTNCLMMMSGLNPKQEWHAESLKRPRFMPWTWTLRQYCHAYLHWFLYYWQML